MLEAVPTQPSSHSSIQPLGFVVYSTYNTIEEGRHERSGTERGETATHREQHLTHSRDTEEAGGAKRPPPGGRARGQEGGLEVADHVAEGHDPVLCVEQARGT